MLPGVELPVVQFNASSKFDATLSLSSDAEQCWLYDYGGKSGGGKRSRHHAADAIGSRYRRSLNTSTRTRCARGVANDVLTAVNAQSLTLPSGDAKMGDKQFVVRVNAMPLTLRA